VGTRTQAAVRRKEEKRGKKDDIVPSRSGEGGVCRGKKFGEKASGQKERKRKYLKRPEVGRELLEKKMEEFVWRSPRGSAETMEHAKPIATELTTAQKTYKVHTIRTLVSQNEESEHWTLLKKKVDHQAGQVHRSLTHTTL